MRDEATLPEIARSLLRSAQQLDQASVYVNGTQRPAEVQKITLDLSTAQSADAPKKIAFPFRSIFVGAATDVLANVNLRVNSRDAFQSSFPLVYKDAVVWPTMIAEAYLDWSAQAGKTMDIYVFTSGEFRSGSQISVTGGGVSIVEGSTVTQNYVTATAAARIQLCVANSSRKLITFQNLTGANIYVGGSGVLGSGSSGTGIIVPPNGLYQFRNTGIFYAWCDAGGYITTLEEQ